MILVDASEGTGRQAPSHIAIAAVCSPRHTDLTGEIAEAFAHLAIVRDGERRRRRCLQRPRRGLGAAQRAGAATRACATAEEGHEHRPGNERA